MILRGGKLGQGLALGVAAAAAAGLLAWSGLLDRWENTTWDWRARLAGRVPSATADAAADSLAVILLDQASLDWGQRANGWSWPWPREVYAAVIDFCREAGTASLAFDVLFSEPSVYGVADDQALGEAIAAHGRFLGAVFVHDDGTVTRPVPEVADNVRALGNVSDVPDPDGVFRRCSLQRPGAADSVSSPAASGNAAVLIPSLGLAQYTLARSQGASPPPEVPAGRPILRFVDPACAWPQYGAAAVIQSQLQLLEGAEPTLDPSLLRGRHVLFGFSAPGLMDLRPTPLSRVSPGVVIHATALANLMAGGFVAATPWGLALAAHSLLAVLTAWLVLAARRTWQSGAVMTVGMLAPAAVAVPAALAGVWWPLVSGLAGQGLTIGGALVLAWSTEGRKKRFISQAFRHYLSPDVIDRIVADPSRLQLGGERRELTIFFSDLEGFTAISESLDPQDLAALLNAYLSDMTDIILESKGTLDKYEGDAIIAFWNAPLDQPDHALRGCRAAVACQRRLDGRREEFTRRFGHALRMRIGLHTGEVTVGNMGSQQRFDYTVLGDAANLASRLEGANKVFGTGVMASAATVERTAGGILARRLGRLQVVGRKAPVTVYEVGGLAGEVEPAHWQTYARALDLCEGGNLPGAGEIFTGLAAGRVQDPAARAWAARLADHQGEFDPVWSLDRK